LLLAGSHLTPRLFGGMLRKIETVASPAGLSCPQDAADLNDEIGRGVVSGIRLKKQHSGLAWSRDTSVAKPRELLVELSHLVYKAS
jgi:hypothetical protein